MDNKKGDRLPPCRPERSLWVVRASSTSYTESGSLVNKDCPRPRPVHIGEILKDLMAKIEAAYRRGRFKFIAGGQAGAAGARTGGSTRR